MGLRAFPPPAGQFHTTPYIPRSESLDDAGRLVDPFARSNIYDGLASSLSKVEAQASSPADQINHNHGQVAQASHNGPTSSSKKTQAAPTALSHERGDRGRTMPRDKVKAHRREVSLHKQPTASASPATAPVKTPSGSNPQALGLGLEHMNNRSERCSPSHIQKATSKQDHRPLPADALRAQLASASPSLADISLPPSPDKSITSLPDLPNLLPSARTRSNPTPLTSLHRPATTRRHPFARPSTGDSDSAGYDTTASSIADFKNHSSHHKTGHQPSTNDILEEMSELGEAHDVLGDMRGDRTPGVIASLAGGIPGANRSNISVGSKTKADKMLGLDPHAKLASFYLVSGLPRDYRDWSLADGDAIRGVSPIEDSMGVFWRPDVLGSAFSGQKTEDWLREMSRSRKESKVSTRSTSTPLSRSIKGVHVPDAGPDGPLKLVTKSIKYAHPRDVEVVNSTLCPPTTCHAFTFTIPKHDTLAAIARTRLDSSVTPSTASMGAKYDAGGLTAADESTHMSVTDVNPKGMSVRNMSSATELTFHGVTLTVWTHADRERGVALKMLKERREKIKNGHLDSFRSNVPVHVPVPDKAGRHRTSLPWGLSGKGSEADVTASETEGGMSDSDLEGVLGRRFLRSMAESKVSVAESLPEETAAVFEDGGDVFWMPYAITMVSRHPIYDVMQDYLRLSWARYSKNAKFHMTQICRMLNHDTPRPDEVVCVEGIMPGALDFDRGIVVKVDFQIWPMFQALDIDHILTCVEVAMSNSGRVVFCSKHPAMLNICVSSLKYIVELRGWDGIVLPMIHARDMTFVIEDPGRYIIGVPTECRHMIALPSEVVMVDIDTNSLTCSRLPEGAVSARKSREKAKQRILAAFGPGLPIDKSIPMEFKVSYPRGTFRNLNHFVHGHDRPPFLGERLRAPSWWSQVEVITAFDKIMLDRHKRPSLLQRLTKSGMARQQAQLTVGEQLAKVMMRRRALHYVETRDDLELKVAKINRRLQKLVQEGEHWRKQFETFEKYADRLTQETNDLKAKIERERREARRLSNVASEQVKANAELEERLRHTETARAEAMRQLSDMHQSIQELEKEREEIMNVFESQINHALQGISGETDSRPPTPAAESALSSPRSRISTLRGGQRLSRENMSIMSRIDAESTISVLGAAKGSQSPRDPAKSGRLRPGTGTTVTSTRSEGGERMDSIHSRIAIIQAKLDLALSNVSRSTEVASSVDGDVSEAEETAPADADADADKQDQTMVETAAKSVNGADDSIGDSVTPTASRRPSKHPFEQVPPVPDTPSGTATVNPDTSLEVDVETRSPTSVHTAKSFPDTEAMREQEMAPAMAVQSPRDGCVGQSANASTVSVPVPSSATDSDATFGHIAGHVQGDETLPQTRSNSRLGVEIGLDASDDVEGSEPDHDDKSLVCDEDEDEAEIAQDEARIKRLSTMSNGTIAFGQQQVQDVREA